MIRFVHTSDWQLGMTRHFLAGEAQARFAQARIDAIDTIGRLAADRSASFVVIAGDLFDSNQPDALTLGRATERLGALPVPVVVVPGNHDHAGPDSVYRTAAFRRSCPDTVTVLLEPAASVAIDGVQIVAAPCMTRHSLHDEVTAACRALETDGTPRVVVGHGQVDQVVYNPDGPANIRLEALEAELARGAADYVALGDRHSSLSVGTTGRIWYSGAPEPTSYREVDRCGVLLVELDPQRAQPPVVEFVLTASWQFHELSAPMDSDRDLDDLIERLDAIEDKSRAVVKLKVRGVVTLVQAARLEAALADRSETFGALEFPERHRDLTIRPDNDDFSELAVSGYAAIARDQLVALASTQGEQSATALDALALMLRLAADGSQRP